MYKEIIVEVSRNCNLNCVMCGYGARYNKPGYFMDFELYTKILTELDGRYSVLRLNGRGESTIHPEFSKFIYYAREKFPKNRIRLFTNMNYNDEGITKALADCSCEVMISLDSVKKENLEKIRAGCNFERVMKNIEELCSVSSTTAIVYTLQPANFYETYEVARFAREHNCHFFCNAVRNYDMESEFNRMVNLESEYLADLYKKMKELFEGTNLMLRLPSQISGVSFETENTTPTCANYASCPNVGQDICINYDGTVTPCGMFNPTEIGNVYHSSIDEIMSSQKFELFKKQQPTNEYCRNCQYMFT